MFEVTPTKKNEGESIFSYEFNKEELKQIQE